MRQYIPRYLWLSFANTVLGDVSVFRRLLYPDLSSHNRTRRLDNARSRTTRNIRTKGTMQTDDRDREPTFGRSMVDQVPIIPHQHAYNAPRPRQTHVQCASYPTFFKILVPTIKMHPTIAPNRRFAPYRIGSARLLSLPIETTRVHEDNIPMSVGKHTNCGSKKARVW
jgi:hypothetical protein